jgi:hypothetical protein
MHDCASLFARLAAAALGAINRILRFLILLELDAAFLSWAEKKWTWT